MPSLDTALTNASFAVELDPATGGIRRLAHPADPHAMNWVAHAADNDWQSAAHTWGLGALAMPGGISPHRWQRPEAVTARRGAVASRYRVGPVEVTVTRTLRAGGKLDEEYRFRNAGQAEQPVWGVGVCVPFNDNYPDAATCVTRRCNAHLWGGGATAYACCLRMGATPPHLGLVLTAGQVAGYSIEGRGLFTGGSNVRGAIFFNLPGFVLPPGGTHRVAWTLFWHTGWDDFLTQARRLPGFVELRADRYTVAPGAALTVTAAGPAIGLEWNGKKVRTRTTAAGQRIMRRLTKPGEQLVTARLADGRESWLRALVTPPVADLVQARVAFIRDRQLVTDRRDPLCGALLSYDNALEARFRNPEWPDQDEGRERIGMGVLLAQALRRRRDPRTAAAARLHHRFVRTRLQDPDGTVLNAVGDRTQRLYNYPWVAQLHVEMYRAFGQRRYLADFCDTVRAYYRRGGERFYSIGVPIVDGLAALRAAGLRREAAEMQQLFRGHADHIVTAGLNIPAHEVNYEQTIIGPATLIPLEYHLASGGADGKYLEHVRALLPCLEAFNGRQPDHHLHEIAIRHWDGFWFGGRRTWGDTFPHYWSALSGLVFCRWWQATGDETYREKGRTVLMNNLSQFTADGRARCVYIYPDAVNGNPGRFWDPLANDQDWALVFLLMAADLDPAFVRDCWG